MVMYYQDGCLLIKKATDDSFTMYVTYTTDPLRLVTRNPYRYFFGWTSFRPTWLVRVSDMQPVPGHEVKEPYHALSYVWSYSGDVEKDEQGEAICIDRGQHKLVFKRQRSNKKPILEMKLVKFEAVIQQVCKDFNIRYIWYDKLCIDQNDKQARQAEIKQMHKVYANAQFTVALIPEMKIPDTFQQSPCAFTMIFKGRYTWHYRGSLADARLSVTTPESQAIADAIRAIVSSEWYNRMWTLEEAVLSQRLVWIGQNAYMWLNNRILNMLYNAFMHDSPKTMYYKLTSLKQPKPSANQVLSHAHERTTTKNHDRVYALANIFAGTINVDINYDQPVAKAMESFYGRLAAADLTVLCFGKPHTDNPFCSTVRNQFDLPSWTGVDGVHMMIPCKLQVKLSTDFSYSMIDGRCMNIRCKYIHAQPIPCAKDYLIDTFDGLQMTHYISDLQSGNAQRENLVATFEESLFRYGASNPGVALSLTEDCKECIVLDIPFSVGYKWWHVRIFPVIKKHEDAYKSIGILFVACRAFYYHRKARLSKFTHVDQAKSFIIK